MNKPAHTPSEKGLPQQWAVEGQRREREAMLREHLATAGTMLKIVQRELDHALAVKSTSASDVNNLASALATAVSVHRTALADLHALLNGGQ